MADKEWIGVDFDGTLAKYTSWKGADHAGEPIKKMVDRVKRWLKAGKDVRIFTARVTGADKDVARKTINDFCQEQFGQKLKITATKDQWMTELWDDRARQVKKNKGDVVENLDEQDVAVKVQQALHSKGFGDLADILYVIPYSEDELAELGVEGEDWVGQYVKNSVDTGQLTILVTPFRHANVHELFDTLSHEIGHALYELIDDAGRAAFPDEEEFADNLMYLLSGRTHEITDPEIWHAVVKGPDDVTEAVRVPKGQTYHVKPGDRVWFEYRCFESPRSADAHLWYRSHRPVTVVRMIEPGDGRDLEERGYNGSAAVFKVRFEDGYEDDATEDELMFSPKEFTRPAPPQPPDGASLIREAAQRVAAILTDGEAGDITPEDLLSGARDSRDGFYAGDRVRTYIQRGWDHSYPITGRIIRFERNEGYDEWMAIIQPEGDRRRRRPVYAFTDNLNRAEDAQHIVSTLLEDTVDGREDITPEDLDSGEEGDEGWSVGDRVRVLGTNVQGTIKAFDYDGGKAWVVIYTDDGKARTGRVKYLRPIAK